MGQLVSQEIKNLVGGVSQQAPSLRLPTQCEKQVNCWNSVVSGMSPRPATKRVGEVDMTDSNSYAIDYRRDEREFYKVIISNNKFEPVKVYDARNGFSLPVTYGPGVLSPIINWNPSFPNFKVVPYLIPRGSVSYDEAFETLPISDSLLILNKTIPIRRTFGGDDGQADPTVTSEVRYNLQVSRIPVERLGSSYYETHPTDTTYSLVQAKDGLPAGYVYEINGQTYQFSQTLDPEEVVVKLAEELEQSNPGYELKILGSILYITVPSGAPSIEITDKSLAAYYYEWERCTQPGGPDGPEQCETLIRYDQTDVTTLAVTSETITTIINQDGRPEHESLIWVRKADYATDYRIFVNGQSASYKTPEATSDRARDGLRTEAIAAELAIQLNNMTGVTCQTYGNTLHLIMDDDYVIDVTDSLGDTAMEAFKRDVANETSLPGTYVPDGYLVRVRGELNEGDANGYWLQYSAKDNLWKESVGIGAREGLVAETMPYLLDRLQDYSFVTEDNPYGIYFRLRVAEWDSRLVGDEDSAPFPSFVSEFDPDSGALVSPRSITAMTIHHNRLLLVSRDTIIASEIGQFFNLFPTTVATMVDSDPFEVQVDTNSPIDIQHVQSMASALILWDSRQQHALKSDSVFTAETVKSSHIASKDVDLSVRPLSLGNRGMFLTHRGKFYGCNELYAADGVEVFDTDDVSGQIPEFLQGNILKMVGSTENNLVLFLSNYVSPENTDTNSNTVYVYNYYDSGRERVQSAWSEWVFNGQVVDLSIDGTEIFLTIEREVEPAKTLEKDGVEADPVFKTYLEKIQLSYDETEQTHGHPVYLDSYVVSETEPTDLAYQEIKKKIDGLWYRGYLMDVLYEFSPFQVRDQDNTAYSTGRLQLKRLLIEYYDTTNFIFEVETLARETRTLLFQGRVLGRLDNIIGKVPVTTGRYSAPIMGRSGAVKVRIRNNEVFGFKFQSATWEGFFHQRSRRI